MGTFKELKQETSIKSSKVYQWKPFLTSHSSPEKEKKNIYFSCGVSNTLREEIAFFFSLTEPQKPASDLAGDNSLSHT